VAYRLQARTRPDDLCGILPGLTLAIYTHVRIRRSLCALATGAVLLSTSNAFAHHRSGNLGALIWMISDRLSLDVDTTVMSSDAPVVVSGYDANGRLPMHLSMSMVGFGTDAQTNVGDVVFVPTLGSTFAAGVSGAPSQGLLPTEGGADTVIDLRPSSTLYYSILLPGLGVHTSRDAPLSFSAMVRTGWSHHTMGGDATTTLESSSIVGRASSFMLVADVELCARVADQVRLCGFAAPKIYEYGWGSGVSFGMRFVYDKNKGF